MQKTLSYFDRMMIAITFAEGGVSVWEEDTGFLQSGTDEQPLDVSAEGAAVSVVS